VAAFLASSSCAVRRELAAVGLIILSRNPLSTGAVGAFLLPFVCDCLESGRVDGARDDLGVERDIALTLGLGFAFEVEGFCIAGAELADSGSCLAREAAVGAVRREDISSGLVTFGLAVFVEEEEAEGLPNAEVFSAAAARATEAAVGAVREDRLDFFVG
jgi:hypothetical protein